MPKIKVKRFKQESAHSKRRHTYTHGDTDGHTHVRYQTYYLPCYAVDNNEILSNNLNGLDSIV